ncbi:hypothetical protein EHW97_09665 [Aeromicrobium camelliae]|uniref:Uncharacterized protein n=1 Tax=Aeromicrobium camelliae TaxID=1538144 RepID=A0A3N6ZKF0_9ACTN|nr:hypothetical protein [Aeromicrobium camelliae]RQN07497.1 hypothetical protein EHW97_09665 [Aeromicrobium camelliae]
MSGQGPSFGGMTVNERLSAAGLLDQFDSAINEGVRERAIELLQQVAMNEVAAATTVDTILGNPTRYGYADPDEDA